MYILSALSQSLCFHKSHGIIIKFNEGDYLSKPRGHLTALFQSAVWIGSKGYTNTDARVIIFKLNIENEMGHI